MARRDLPPDQRVVDALCRGVLPPRQSTYVERVAAIRHLAAQDFTDPQIAHLVRCNLRTVARVRREHGIPGCPVGTNGFTRRRVWPLEPRNQRK